MGGLCPSPSPSEHEAGALGGPRVGAGGSRHVAAPSADPGSELAPPQEAAQPRGCLRGAGWMAPTYTSPLYIELRRRAPCDTLHRQVINRGVICKQLNKFPTPPACRHVRVISGPPPAAGCDPVLLHGALGTLQARAASTSGPGPGWVPGVPGVPPCHPLPHSRAGPGGARSSSDFVRTHKGIGGCWWAGAALRV